MTQEQYFKNLRRPEGKIDIILDTDTYNEIDDQYAIAYMLGHSEKFNVKGITAAPFFNQKSTSPEDGMEKSYHEILKVLDLMSRHDLDEVVFRGSKTYLPDEKTPVDSPAADFMANLANDYTPENPLYILGIGAITNVASAILKNPAMTENCVIVWLGGSSFDMPRFANEFNMVQDIAAARVLCNCKAPLVLIPAWGVTDHLLTTKYELEHWLRDKNKICTYLLENTINEAESYASGKPWSRVIWDIAGITWFVNDGNMMQDRLVHSPVPQYDMYASKDERRHLIKYVWYINRDKVFEDLFNTLYTL
ncbi:MAG: nucleoside hydrolase [Clostridia bacterium]|nr:nucleoside hydrolase [Clostridia bacterium]